MYPFFTALTSKAKGQYLRVSLPMHALFQSAPLEENLPKTIPEKVIKASVSLVRLCNFHTAIIAGREIANGNVVSQMQQGQETSTVQPLDDDKKLQQLVLTQPGAIVSASRLLHISKFRSSGGKQRVLLTLSSLANKHMGTVAHRRGNVSLSLVNIKYLTFHFFFLSSFHYLF